MTNEELEKQIELDRRASQDRDASILKVLNAKDKLQSDNYSKCASKQEFETFSKAVLRNIELIMQEFTQQKLVNDNHVTRLNANHEAHVNMARQSREYVDMISKKHDDIFCEIKSLLGLFRSLEAFVVTTKADLLSKFSFVEDELKVDLRRISNDYPKQIEIARNELLELIHSLSSKGSEKTFEKMVVLEKKLGELMKEQR